MIAKDSAKHDEHGASFSDLCKIMSPSKKKKMSPKLKMLGTLGTMTPFGVHTRKKQGRNA